MKQNPNLTNEQKEVLFNKGTEQPFSGKLLHNKNDGMYNCANCKAPLFASNTKFDSGSGWPSFDSAIDGAVEFHDDSGFGMKRTEVICSKCKGHLGHVFDDGPQETTGKRFCINSCSLGFEEKK